MGRPLSLCSLGARPAPGRVALALGALAAITMWGCGPDPAITARDGSVMVLIPKGEFQMGGQEEDVAGAPDAALLTYHAERPLHRVALKAFYLDKHEVTNLQYRAFLEAVAGGGGRWDHADQPAEVGHEQRFLTEELTGDQQPAVGLNWYDAYAYCNWAGKRLPSEAEWEYAARGGDGYRKFPWGNDAPDADDIWWANYRPNAGRDADGYRASAPVGSYPDGVSPFGVMDMSGNAEEWVNDWYSVNYYRASEGAQDPPGPATGQKKVIKGGSYESDPIQLRIAMRFYGKPHDKGPRIGFRCAMDP